MKTVNMLAIATCLIAGTAANAQSIHVTLDGTRIDFPGTQPQMMNNRVMVPLRGVFEEFGANVNWDLANRTVYVTDHDRRITMEIGSRIAIVNGNRVTLDAPASIVNGRAMVPLRFISENVLRDVYWNSKTRTVEIDSIAAIVKKNLPDNSAQTNQSSTSSQ